MLLLKKFREINLLLKKLLKNFSVGDSGGIEDFLVGKSHRTVRSSLCELDKNFDSPRKSNLGLLHARLKL